MLTAKKFWAKVMIMGRQMMIMRSITTNSHFNINLA